MPDTNNSSNSNWTLVFRSTSGRHVYQTAEPCPKCGTPLKYEIYINESLDEYGEPDFDEDYEGAEYRCDVCDWSGDLCDEDDQPHDIVLDMVDVEPAQPSGGV